MSVDFDQENLGPLEALIGTWRGTDGWHVIAVKGDYEEKFGKKAGKDSGNHYFKCFTRGYVETATYSRLEALPEEFFKTRKGKKLKALKECKGGLRYEIEIHDIDQDEAYPPIHTETGYLLYFEDKHFSPLDHNVPGKEYSIVRYVDFSPEGSTEQMLVVMAGNSTYSHDRPWIHSVSSLPLASDLEGAPEHYLQPYRDQQERWLIPDAAEGRTPKKVFDVLFPNNNLIKDNLGLHINNTRHIALDSANLDDLDPLPYTNRGMDVVRSSINYWITEAKLPMSGQNIQRLQYSQVVDVAFMRKFTVTDDSETYTSDDYIKWPHITINTLVKQD